MKLGIIGFPASGKTSLFNAVTGGAQPVGQYSNQPGQHLGIMTVPDARLWKLRDMYKPKSFKPAVVDCLDFTGLISGSGGGGKEIKGELLGKLREVDAIVQIVRAFESDDVPHVLESVDPLRDFGEIDSELLFADLAQTTTRVEKLRVQATKPTKTQEQDKKELATLEKVLALLEDGKPVRQFKPANEDEQKHVDAFQFLTDKEQVVVFNVGEGDLGPGGKGEELEAKHPGSVALCAKLEMEIGQLPEAERAVFLADMGIKEAASAKLARQAFAALGSIAFFTVGEDEVRAWTIQRGDTAVVAAGKIHTDLSKGFIRAEVFSYEELIAAGDEKAVKAAGKFRLEGKEYVVQDADIVHVRANTR
ncbi:MAG: redox-regulated ATPase YchF [Planctomycetes bacterium]|nr:redox-regulated ATPase YchF [Planctomycetota bacterium]